MVTGEVDSFVRQLVRGMAAGGLAGQTDRQLVERLSATPDEAAFEALVRRHGPMVYRVCWRVLQQAEDAEDAFQATFLLLAQKLGTLRNLGSLAGWLHGVANRVALDARKRALRRRQHESRACALTTPADGADWCEVRAVLDAELAALPESQRLPLILCYLEGQTQDEAARQLGWSKSTLLRRLEAARAALGRRLTRRGFAWSVAGSAVLLSDALAPAALTPKIICSTVTAAVGTLSGLKVTVVLSANALTLTKGALSTMFPTKLKFAAALLVAVVAAGGLVGISRLSAQPEAPMDNLALAVRAAPVPAAKPNPLPAGPNRLLLGRADRLSLVDPDGKHDKDLLSVSPAHDSVRLSPDGKRVAYVTRDRTADKALLHVAGVDDKKGQSLGVSPRSYAWSPDGTEIAYSEFPESDKTESDKRWAAVHGIIDVKSKEKAVLKLPDDHYVTDWSRDGKHLVTTRIWPKGGGVFLMNRDGTEHKELTADLLPAGSHGGGGRLSPDGKRLLFRIVTPEKGKLAQVELTVLDIATGKLTPVADVPTDELEELHSPCWSPDGKRIAYCWTKTTPAGENGPAAKEVETQVVVCDPDGKNAKAVASEKGKLVTIPSLDWK
jgi:RNA polymerase sigma factor (sigma-70 family)